MKNSFGTNISLTLFGESHGEKIGVVLDGLPAGFEISMERL
jgi:chorismate synthase